METYVASYEELYKKQGIKGFLTHRLGLGRPESAGVYYAQARIQAFIGEKEKALEDLEQAFRERAFLLAFVKADPIFDGLRAEARYQGVIKNMGL